MKVIKVNLPNHLKDIILFPLADLHIGEPSCNMEIIKKNIEYIKNTPNCFCILNGDIIDNGTRNSIGDVYSQTLSPHDQVKLAVSIFEPIKNKIIAITNGNHEERTYRDSGIDIMGMFAMTLGLEDYYCNESAVIFVKFGVKRTDNRKNSKYTACQVVIYATHGRGGGRKEGAKAIRLADMANIVDADIYIHSHTHLPMSMKECFFRTDLTKQAIVPCEKLFVNTGSSLNYAKYAEKIECKPNSTATPRIRIYFNYENNQHHKKMRTEVMF